MHELGRPGRRPARQVVHFTEKNRVSPARRIARDAATIHSVSNNGEVVDPIQRTLPRQSPCSFLAIWLSFWSRAQRKSKASESWDLANLACDAPAVMPRESGASSTPRLLDQSQAPLEYWIARSSRAMTSHTLLSAGGTGSAALSSISVIGLSIATTTS